MNGGEEGERRSGEETRGGGGEGQVSARERPRVGVLEFAPTVVAGTPERPTSCPAAPCAPPSTESLTPAGPILKVGCGVVFVGPRQRVIRVHHFRRGMLLLLLLLLMG